MTMRKAVIAALVVLAGLCLAASALAAGATKDECIAKTKEAAKMVADKGLDAAIAEINKKDGKFVWKDSYVFMMDLDGKMLAHPLSPALVGKNLLDMKDKAVPAEKGKFLFKEFIEVAKGKGSGWVEYMWTNPGDPKPRKKVTFTYRVPGQNVYVGAGVYE